jgi:VanZ family protein
MIADTAIFTYLTVGIAVACSAYDDGRRISILFAVLVGATWFVAAIVMLGETVGGWVRR